MSQLIIPAWLCSADWIFSKPPFALCPTCPVCHRAVHIHLTNSLPSGDRLIRLFPHSSDGHRKHKGWPRASGWGYFKDEGWTGAEREWFARARQIRQRQMSSGQ